MPRWCWQEIHCDNCKLTYWRWGMSSPPSRCGYCGGEIVFRVHDPVEVRAPKGLVVMDGEVAG